MDEIEPVDVREAMRRFWEGPQNRMQEPGSLQLWRDALDKYAAQMSEDAEANESAEPS